MTWAMCCSVETNAVVVVGATVVVTAVVGAAGAVAGGVVAPGVVGGAEALEFSIGGGVVDDVLAAAPPQEARRTSRKAPPRRIRIPTNLNGSVSLRKRPREGLRGTCGYRELFDAGAEAATVGVSTSRPTFGEDNQRR
jgi:hypothetical protein